MTTIAWDGRHLVSDGMVLSGGQFPMILQTDFVKIRMIEELRPARMFGGATDGVVLAACGAGCVAECRTFMDWFLEQRSGKFKLPEDSEGFAALAVICEIRDRKPVRLHVTEYDEMAYEYVIDRPTALGSGAHYATAVMRAGLDALTAMRVTRDLDLHTGGTITYVDFSRPELGVQTMTEEYEHRGGLDGCDPG